MNFLWHTALSVVDLSSSLMYNLLGRDLTESDIQLVEQLFAYVSKSELNSVATSAAELERLIELDSKNMANLTHSLLQSIDSSKSKDLLLITNKHTGYNLIQTMITCTMQLAGRVLGDNAHIFAHKSSSDMDNDLDYLIGQRLNLFSLLLKSYSCDPNRGLLLSNKTKYCVHVAGTERTVRPSPPPKPAAARPKLNNVLVDFETGSSEKIDSDTRSELTADTIVKNSPSRLSPRPAPASPCSHITNIELAFVTAHTDQQTIDQLANTPIDTPLLLLCCVYSCTNLASVSQSSNKQTLERNDFSAYRRNTVQSESQADVALLKLSRSNSLNSVANRHSDSYSLWSSSSSSSSSGGGSSHTSSSFSSASSLSFGSFSSSPTTSRSKLFKSSVKLTKTLSDSSDNFKPVAYAESDSSGSSNLFEYDEKDELTFYDKYDHDFNSVCYKLSPSEPHAANSTHSLLSSDENCRLRPKWSTCSTNSGSSTGANFAHHKLNQLRLKLVDSLLDNGADKYLIAKLSAHSLAQMNKRSRLALKKWFDWRRDDEQTGFELRPVSPMMAALCLDDVDMFARLYKHQHLLFSYFRPDEDYELIYYAIKFQSKHCLVYLLSNLNSESVPRLLDSAGSSPLNKNVNTMFYILENTRSSKIIKVLLNCGFDLTKREPATGNTALHCLFNEQAAKSKFAKSKKVLAEYTDPESLARILFLMLKKGGLRTHVNALNNERKLCVESLFEWDELVETVFFKEVGKVGRHQWKTQFKECVRLLLKAGADLLLNINNVELDNHGYHNCIATLLNTLLRRSALGLRAKFSLHKVLDIEFLEYMLNDLMDVNLITLNLAKNGPLTYPPAPQDHALRLPQRDCSVEKYLELLLHSQIDEFASAHQLFDTLLNFQLCLNNKMRVRLQSSFKSWTRLINPHVIKRLLTNWILCPNFLNSSQQFEKNNFVKHVLVELIKHELYDPNDSSCHAAQTPAESVQSNNLLSHCVQLVFASKTCYQLELVYDLMRTLIQHGADPNLAPFDLSWAGAHRHKATNSILAQLCDPFLTERPSPILTSVNLSRHQSTHHKKDQHRHHHHHHHHHHSYFNDYFKDKLFSVINENGPVSSMRHVSPLVSEKEIEVTRRMSEGCVSPNFTARKHHLSNPICLLTPSASFASFLALNNLNGVTSNVKSNNIVVDSMVLFLNYYKRFVKLLFDSMENSKINEIFVSKSLVGDLQLCSHHNHQHHHSYHHSSSSMPNAKNLPPGQKVYSLESLDMYLERLVSSPRSLKSICRRMILSRLKENGKLTNDLNNESTLIQVTAQIDDLPAPKPVKNYLLFIE
ncbi:hypothetical protein BpHYR1_010782 [Brachionus plicatilis]|uniref:SOCS box domain-containing protein n=1 Tax=Brachionus plicatilis TaxID=10195 RepID=A0A3M7QVS7_BRAPC|nr:hypothetical protein BpHYR1_010782 [Brachionus plicatilis]